VCNARKIQDAAWLNSEKVKRVILVLLGCGWVGGRVTEKLMEGTLKSFLVHGALSRLHRGTCNGATWHLLL
jgi:hypothetical protein